MLPANLMTLARVQLFARIIKAPPYVHHVLQASMGDAGDHTWMQAVYGDIHYMMNAAHYPDSALEKLLTASKTPVECSLLALWARTVKRHTGKFRAAPITFLRDPRSNICTARGVTRVRLAATMTHLCSTCDKAHDTKQQLT